MKVQKSVINSLSINPLTCRVYYEDTDAGGVMYHASYLRFAERGRNEWLRSIIKPEGDRLWNKEGPLFVIRHMEIDYLASAKLEDVLTIETVLTRLGGASFGLTQIIKCDDKTLSEMKVTTVCLGQDKKPLRISPEWRQKLTPYLKEGV